MDKLIVEIILFLFYSKHWGNRCLIKKSRNCQLYKIVVKTLSLLSSLYTDNLLEMLQSLRSRLEANDESCHCGGQFEWVDGQLVEALKSGYWLLIDNVNFCR